MNGWGVFVYIFFSFAVFFLILGVINPIFFLFALFVFALAVGYYYSNRKPSSEDIPSYYPADSQPSNKLSSPELSNPSTEKPFHLEEYHRFSFEESPELSTPPFPQPPPPENSESPLELENSPPDLEYMSKIEKAKWMRNNPTPAEKRMMEILNSSVIPNFPEHYFDVQSLQYGYTLDFYFPTLRLAIEIDGGSHNNKVGYDWERDTNLERRGIRTLRATNEQVFNNPQGLTESLCKIIQDKITEQVQRENTYSAKRHNREKYRRQY